jgi:hypothetical protein
MSLSVAKANLMDALKTLRIRLQKAANDWDDDTRKQFEEEFIAPLDAKIQAAAKGLDHVSDLIAAARRDCGDDL